MKLKKYTVLLRYPEYSTTNWPDDTYTILVSAHSYDAAADVARNTAFRRINKGLTVDELVVCQPDDLQLICAIKGDHKLYRCM
jgi:hypothetical protein